ncbi:MAG: restriction endonuclease subunit S [Methylococcus sp.]
MPKLRFPEFRESGEWGSEFGDAIFDQINNKEHNSDLPVLAITQEQGAIPRNLIDYHVSVTDKSIENYKVVEVGDFIISLRSFQGGIEYSSYKGICSPAYVILRLKTGYSSDYFKHFLKTSRFIALLTKNLEGLRDGKMVSYKQFSELELPSPSLNEQQKIADCLTSLDELITLEAQKLDTLKTHKNGLMQQLFPAEGETLPQRRFSEVQDTGEWETYPFDEFVANSFYGTSSSTSPRGQYPVLRMGNMVDGGLDFSNLVYIDLDRNAFESFQLVNGDILMNRTNSPALVGKVSLFCLNLKCLTASYIVTYRLKKDRIDPSFCNFMLNTALYQKRIRALAKPSISQANINPTTFRKELIIFVPALAEQQKIADCLSSLDHLITAQSQKLAALKTHKKGLMQQLFPNTYMESTP